MRCEYFAQRGLLWLLYPNRLSPKRLVDAVASVADSSSVTQPARFREIAHHGIKATTGQLAALLPVPVGPG